MGGYSVILTYVCAITSITKKIAVLRHLVSPFIILKLININATWMVREHTLYVCLLILLLKALTSLLSKLCAVLIYLWLVVTVAIEECRIDLRVHYSLYRFLKVFLKPCC